MTLRYAIAIVLAILAGAARAAEDTEPSGAEFLHRADVDLILGETSKAVADLERAIAVPGASASYATWRLALLHEKRGEWKQALQRWLDWDSSAGADCGNGAQQFGEERLRGIARCQFHLGFREAAILGLRQRVVEPSTIDGRFPETVALYVELCARSGRLAEARRVIIDLPVDDPDSRRGRTERTRYRVSLGIAEAFVGGCPADVLEAVRLLEPERTMAYRHGPWPAEPEWLLAAKLLAGMGEEAMTTLGRAIPDGDDHAIVLAGMVGDPRLVPPLEACQAAAGGSDEMVSEALMRLRWPRYDEP